MYFKIEYISKGQIKSVIVSASSVSEALKEFKRRNLGIIKNIEEYEKESFLESIVKKIKLNKIDLEEYIAVLEQMYVMLDAGLPIDTVLNEIKRHIKNKTLRKIFESVSNDIKAGLGLTEAFSKFQDELGILTISMIKLGEKTGDLANAIKDLSIILSEILENRKRLKKATRYPLFIIFAMSVAFVIVILFVIPPFKAVFAEIHTQLPLPTRFLLWIEAAIKKYGLFILIGGVIIFSVITYFYNKNEKVKLFLDKLILKIYIVGPVIRLAMLGRFVYVFYKLVESGIPIVDAVDIALNIVENSYIRKNLEKIKSAIISGGTITHGFRDSGMFESMIIQMIAAGEESGSLVLMLKKVSNYYFDKYRYIVDNIAVLIEPILIAAIAGFVMTLALGIFLPMWNLTQSIR